ncbi:hypothetical protein NL676_021533 [Syzygium grande]|nr:hypothetical protein NL676_021533 [Syzygium grande]
MAAPGDAVKGSSGGKGGSLGTGNMRRAGQQSSGSVSLLGRANVTVGSSRDQDNGSLVSGLTMTSNRLGISKQQHVGRVRHVAEIDQSWGARLDMEFLRLLVWP